MKKFFTLTMLLLCAVVGMKADPIKVGFTSSKDGNTVAAPTVTTQDNVTVSVARGSQDTGTGKGSMYWGSTTALTFSGRCERTKYSGSALPASFNNNVWTGAKYAIASGYKFTVTDIQVDIAGQDYDWYVRVAVVNGDGTEVYNSDSQHPGTPKVSSKKQITATKQSLVLTGDAYVKVYYYYKASSQSDSKYLAVPELYLTGTVEANTQSKYTKPSITQGAYNQSEGTYPVTLAVQNEEDGTINYTVGSAAEVTGAASGTVLNLAPGTTITAYVTGSSYSNSDNSTLTTSAAPTLATPTYSVDSYDLMKNLYTVTLSAKAGDITYTISGTSSDYVGALQLSPETEVEAFATQTNMTQSATLSFTVPAAPTGGSTTSPTTSGTYENNVRYNMGAITIPGACIAGQISSGTTPINGSIKTRCNQGLTKNTGFYVTVNPGFTITGIKIVGCSNQTDANICNAVYVDGVAVEGFTAVSLPLAAKEGSTGTIDVTGINATNKIEFAFENTYQAQMNITVTCGVSASSTLAGVSGFSKAFSTFCAPQNFTITGATAYKAQINSEALILTPLEGVIPASEGVIIAGDDAASYTITYVSDDATADVTGNNLQGVNVRTLTSTLAGSGTLLALNSAEASFQQYAGTYFPANKAYLIVPSAARSLNMIFSDEIETTAVNGVADTGTKMAIARKFMKDGKLVISTSKGVFNVTGTRIQ